jgi:hypothetical protein
MECHFAGTMFYSEAHPSLLEVLSEWKREKLFAYGWGRAGRGKKGTNLDE